MPELIDTKYVKGAERLGRRIRTIRAALALPPMVEAIGALLLRRTITRYDKEVDPDGRKWKPLVSATLERRRRGGGQGGTKILQQTGSLRAAIRLIRGRADGGISTNTGAGVRIGVTDPKQVTKARVHQRGYKNIPVRRFLGISRLDVEAVDGFMRRESKKIGRTL